MNYGNIKSYDIADGTGVRVSLFVSGCRHHCKGCFNASTWDLTTVSHLPGRLRISSWSCLLRLIQRASPYSAASHSSQRISLFWQSFWKRSGVPFRINPSGVTVDIFLTKIWFPEVRSTLLLQTGCFPASTFWQTESLIQELKNLSLQFRGSSNQRILHLKDGKLIKEGL